MGNAGLKIIHLCWTDSGGAGIAARRLHQGLCQHLPMTVVTPSAWLGNMSARSSILGHCPHQVIPNGLPCDTFRPLDKAAARFSLGLPTDKVVLLFGAATPHVHRKGLVYLQQALQAIAQSGSADSIGLAIYGEMTEDLSFPPGMQVYPSGNSSTAEAP